MPTEILVTVDIAKAKIEKINSNQSSSWWSQLPNNEINARACLSRLEEIVVSGVDGWVSGGAAEVFSILD